MSYQQIETVGGRQSSSLFLDAGRARAQGSLSARRRERDRALAQTRKTGRLALPRPRAAKPRHGVNLQHGADCLIDVIHENAICLAVLVQFLADCL